MLRNDLCLNILPVQNTLHRIRHFLPTLTRFGRPLVHFTHRVRARRNHVRTGHAFRYLELRQRAQRLADVITVEFIRFVFRTVRRVNNRHWGYRQRT